MRIPIRVSFIVGGIALLALLVHVISRLLFFRSLFYEHSGIRITQPEIAAAFAKDHGANRTQHIPKIIHHIFHNWREPEKDSIPDGWGETRKGCMELNPDFEFKFWGTKASRDFIETEYPWFLRTYDNYKYPVQRVDAVRYFLMLHYGGIYMDLDNGCRIPLEPLLYYPAFTTDGGRGALSNNILASRPHHPFWHHVTLALLRYNWRWPLPYVRIMYASGQWFLTAIWEEYHALLPPPSESKEEHRLYRVMMDGRPGADDWTFFSHSGGGGSWNNWDNRVFNEIGEHLGLFFTCLFVALALVGWIGVRCWRRWKGPGGYRYRRVGSPPSSSGSVV